MHVFTPESQDAAAPLRVLSWNLLRRVGARAEDVAGLIRSHKPDLVLLQEATEDIESLPDLVGGHFHRHGMAKRIYGLAAWSAEPFDPTLALRLPASVIPGKVPPRLAQLVKFRGIHFANVHLSHGQFLNRWQLLHIAEVLEGPAASSVTSTRWAQFRCRAFAMSARAAAPTGRAMSCRCGWTAAWRGGWPAMPPRCWKKARPTIIPLFSILPSAGQ